MRPEASHPAGFLVAKASRVGALFGVWIDRGLLDIRSVTEYQSAPATKDFEKDLPVGSVVKKRRKKMRKHKQRKLLKRQRHKRKR